MVPLLLSLIATSLATTPAHAQLPPLHKITGGPSGDAREAAAPTDVGAPVIQTPIYLPKAKAESASTALFMGDDQGVVQVQAKAKNGDEEYDFVVATDFPGPERLFRRESESQVFERIRMENKKRPGGRPVLFPDYQPLTKEPFKRREFPMMMETVEPSYVCHGRLFFEQPNFERQGWDLGVLTPAINLGVFWYDLALLPYHAWSKPFDHCDASSGKCLPGDPTPLYLYREPFSVTGLAGQAAAVTGVLFAFPP